MKTFLLKAKHFFKRNIYPITVTMCTVLVLAIIAVSAYSAISSSNQEIPVDNQTAPQVDVNFDNNTNSNIEDDKKPTAGTDVIIFDLPFSGAKVTKKYDDENLLYDKTTQYWQTHQGLDFACREGQEVVAVFSGEVIKIENSMMNGTVVYLKITDELTVVYKGLSSKVAVKENDKVEKGQLIGTVSTMLSEKADGIHLHLEMTKAEEWIDPTDYFSPSKWNKR